MKQDRVNPLQPEFDITEIAKILVQLGLEELIVVFFSPLIENILNKQSIKPALAVGAPRLTPLRKQRGERQFFIIN